ncbi:phosphoethanolamine transferase [Pasteurella bettyae]|uniref:Arylsulfatase n=1 Tax=Pasteurella bettyae CCUG 2042 TaxID=1095749 RepID=I3D7K3_9PAST|nr:sulfatase-like hydrolase/transferase [Pasteurella bettyae]EIJ67696.1 arylsulfatase [Pasteurella bettyae CCUG 2042]SUB22212.1 protein DcaA [Pasteurella bettyae]
MNLLRKLNFKNLLIIFIYTFLLLISELLYRHYFDIPNIPVRKLPESFLFIFIFVVIFFYAKLTISRIFVFLFFTISIIGNNIHYEVYKSWLTGIHYYLSITEFHEATAAGGSLIPKMFPQISWGIMECLFFGSLLMFNQRRSQYADIGLIILLLLALIKGVKTDQEGIISPKLEYNRIKENYLVIGQFFTRILPSELFNLHNVAYYHHDEPEKSHQPDIRNIIFIVGESETSKHTSLFGYHRKTTPFMDSLANDPNSIIKQAFSGGTLTILSLPSLFNAIPYPNGERQIQSGNTNLFKLAKQQNFKTYFYSSQAENQMGMVSLLGARWIDDVRFPTYWGYQNKDNMPDKNLLPSFYDINLTDDYHFIILHQRASHLPYGELLTKDENYFGDQTLLDRYDNTIYQTDLFIKSVFDHLKATNRDDWLLIYTSDHGQLVNNEQVNQGNYLPDNYLVPLVIYTPNNKLAAKLKNIFDSCPKASHHQLSTSMINLLGYHMPIADCQTSYINGDVLSGDLGYYKISQPAEQLEYIPATPPAAK